MNGLPGAGVGGDARANCATPDAPRATPDAPRSIRDATRRAPAATRANPDANRAIREATGRAPAAGPHGGDGARLAAMLGLEPSAVLDLSASLNPLASDPVPVVAAHLDALGRYPDPTSASAVLAEVLGVEVSRVVLTNGGAEAIALVAAELGPGWVEEPEFSLYRRHLPGLDRSGPRWRSNPHNPSGTLAGAAETAGVWDEAFWPMATGTWTRGDAETGAVVIGSLTKLLACPGLRAGYALCPDPDLARRLRARQPAWSVNGLVCAALPALLERVDLAATSVGIASLRADLDGLLRRAGLAPEASAANWLVVAAPGLRDFLAGRGVLVRDCTSFGRPGVVRVAVPGPDGLARLGEALGRWEQGS